MADLPLHFGIQTPQEGATFDDLSAHWRVADDLGFDSVWVDDHLYSVILPRSESQMDAWMLLAALARETRRIRMGVLVSCNSFRNPALVAKMAATVDVLSGGRLIHGVGAGWFEDEYLGYGYEFPPTRTRLAQLEESLRLQKLLWTEEQPSFDGRHYQLNGAWCEPRPAQKPFLPILVGGGGEKILLKIVARHADIWNCPGSIEELRRKIGILADHCAAVGRDPEEIQSTWFGGVIVDRDAGRAEARLESLAKSWGMPIDMMASSALAGTPEAVIDRIHAYREVGITGFIGVHGREDDFETTRLMGERVLPAFR